MSRAKHLNDLYDRRDEAITEGLVGIVQELSIQIAHLELEQARRMDIVSNNCFRDVRLTTEQLN